MIKALTILISTLLPATASAAITCVRSSQAVDVCTFTPLNVPARIVRYNDQYPNGKAVGLSLGQGRKYMFHSHCPINTNYYYQYTTDGGVTWKRNSSSLNVINWCCI